MSETSLARRVAAHNPDMPATGDAEDPLAAADDGRRLHGDDREPAIRLDTVRRSDRGEISLGPRRDPGRVHAVRFDRNLAGADRSVVRRQIWSARGAVVRRDDDRDRLGDQRARRLARAALHRRDRRRHRRRLDLRHLRRQCAEMVSGPPRPCRGLHRGRLRRRRGADRRADLADDRGQRLSSARFCVFGLGQGVDGVPAGAVHSPAADGDGCGEEEARDPADLAEHRAARRRCARRRSGCSTPPS